MPTPSGCKLGTRPMDAFIENMQKMGCNYTYEGGVYEVFTDGLQAAHFCQWFPSVTATENLIMMAVLTPGTTIIENAACEPHVQDVCNMLVSLGAKISGIGSNRLAITGVESLTGGEWTVISDHLDVAGLIAATVMTGGEITITHAIVPHMDLTLQAYKKLGISVDVDRDADTIHVTADQSLKI